MFGKNHCKQIEPLLWDFSANRLREKEQERVHTHLKACLPCRKQEQAYRQAQKAVQVYRELPVPESQTSWQALRRQIEQEQTPHVVPVCRRSLNLAWGSALLILLLVGSIANFWNGGRRVKPAVDTSTPVIATANTNAPSNRIVTETTAPEKAKAPHQAKTATNARAHKPEVKAAHSSGSTRKVVPADVPPRPRRRIRYRSPMYMADGSHTPAPSVPKKHEKQVTTRLARNIDGERPLSSGPGNGYVLPSVPAQYGDASGYTYVMGGVPPASAQTSLASHNNF